MKTRVKLKANTPYRGATGYIDGYVCWNEVLAVVVLDKPYKKDSGDNGCFLHVSIFDLDTIE